MTRGKDESPFIYFEAKPKRGNSKIVVEAISQIQALFCELYDRRANCNMHTEIKDSQWTIPITYENDDARDLLNNNEKFQELLTDLRVYCKPTRRFKRKLFAMLHPGQRLGGIIEGPFVVPK